MTSQENKVNYFDLIKPWQFQTQLVDENTYCECKEYVYSYSLYPGPYQPERFITVPLFCLNCGKRKRHINK